MAQRHTHPHMSKKLFKIARSGRVIGDFTAKQICEGILSGHFLGTDHYWDADKNAWLLLKEKYWRETEAPETETENVPFKKRFWHNPIPGSAPDRWFLGMNNPIHWLTVVPFLASFKAYRSFLSKSGSDNQVIGWTIIATIVATLAYFFGREGEDALKTKGELAQKNKAQPPYLWTGYFVTILAVCTVGYSFTKTGGKTLGDLNPIRQELKYEVWSDFDREIFPCVEIAFSKLNVEALEKLVQSEKDDAHEFSQEKMSSTIGVRLYDVRKGDRYEIRIQSEGRPALIGESTYVFTSDADYAHSIAYPQLSFDYGMLRASRQTVPLNIKFSVKRNSETPKIVNQAWHVRQINDCPIGMRITTLKTNGTVKKEPANIAIMTFASFVNENHPEIPRILEEALATGKVAAFTGYQEGTDLSVIKQLHAVWDVLEKKGIRYSSIGTTTGSKTAVQHVRLIEDTLNTRQANCVDGSALFASIATKIGLDAYLVLAPGHCYVAIEMPESITIGIEMTVLGTEGFGEAVAIATTKADYALRRNLNKFEDNDDESGYALVPIAACRELGIQPISAAK